MPRRKKEPITTTANDARDSDASSGVAGGLKDPTLNSRVANEETDDDGIRHYKIPFGDKSIACEQRGEKDGSPSLIFTHGAGGGVANPATRDFAAGFATVASVVCYQGTLNLKSRIKTFHAVVEYEKSGKVLGGRSMGARAAVLTALEMETKPEALVLVSYPLMAGKKGEKREPERREQILLDLPGEVDVLFVVGSKDQQCDFDELRKLREKMKAKNWLIEVQDADHGMSLKVKDAVQSIRIKSGALAAGWLKDRDVAKRYCSISWSEDEEQVISTVWRELDHPTAEPKRKKQRTA